VAKHVSQKTKKLVIFSGINNLSDSELNELGAVYHKDIVSIALDQQDAMTNASTYLVNMSYAFSKEIFADTFEL